LIATLYAVLKTLFSSVETAEDWPELATAGVVLVVLALISFAVYFNETLAQHALLFAAVIGSFILGYRIKGLA
jgi:hypothetical protein